MDALLSRLGYQALNMAMRSGIALTSTYAITQCSRLMKKVDDKNILADLRKLRKQLDSKITVLSPAIDLIEFKSGRGNAFLESAVPLARALHADITSLGKDLEEAAAAAERSHNDTTPDQQYQQFKQVVADIKDLLARIDRDIPLLHMAITASGESLASSLSQGVSPSRLLQASTLLNFGDTQYAHDPTRPVQIGPSFSLSLYMLFLGHAGQTNTSPATMPGTPDPPRKRGQTDEPYGLEEGDRKPLWQEVLHKARVRLCRMPLNHAFNRRHGYQPEEKSDVACGTAEHFSLPSQIFEGYERPNEYSYHLEIIEDLDDGRLHDDNEAEYHPYDDIPRAGIRESMPIHQLSKIFYADTGRILNIGNAQEDNNPVLLLKRDVSAWSAASDWSDMRPSSHHTEALSPNGDNEQDDIDRQIREESICADEATCLATPTRASDAENPNRSWSLPGHLDPEWLAFEVFIDDDEADEEASSDSSIVNDETERSPNSNDELYPKPRIAQDRSSIDAKLLEQLKTISVGSSPSSTREIQTQQSARNFVARSPFGAITTSLSLMEMLIRLTSLQEFQQASHLSIDDHILTFFLEETSTTGLDREERWTARNEAKRRVGFDPYTDTPTKS